MNRRLHVRLFLSCTFGCLAVGCEKSPYELAPVHGTVTVDGRPLAEGKVMFTPAARATDKEAGKVAVGRLSSDGTYTLTTMADGDGAPVGEHWVTVLWPKPKAKAAPVAGLPPRGPEFARYKVPELKSVVAGQENQIDVPLTQQEFVRLGSQ